MEKRCFKKSSLPSFLKDPDFIDISKLESIFEDEICLSCALCSRCDEVLFSQEGRLYHYNCNNVQCTCLDNEYYEEVDKK